MNKRGTLVQFVIFIFVIALITYFVYYSPEIDLSKPIVEETDECMLKIENNSIKLVEGENGFMDVEFETDLAGTYTFAFFSSPEFSSITDSFVSPALIKTKFKLLFTNATPLELESGEYQTRWKKAELRVSGPLSCKSSFQVTVKDNCVEVYNPLQEDLDEDGIGDACDLQTCNNSICEDGEGYTNCCNDCGCLPGQTCVNNNCTGEAFACLEHSDCKDGIKCTRDLCFHPNTSNAHCGHIEITECSKDREDNCCPANCNANNDIDCEPDCRNDICEDFYDKEDYKSCHWDCDAEDDDD